MQWYDSVIIIGVVIGIFIALLGDYHHGTRKSGLMGWILIIVLLIIRVSIWIASMIK